MDTKDKIKKDKFRFGGMRSVVLERDKYSCVSCGMTEHQHKIKWGRSITINHIDGNGRNSKKPNNNINNLETLCLKCHGHKDGLRTTSNQYGKF